MKLLTTQNAKTTKGEVIGPGYLTGILYLAPHKLSGYNVCPWSTPGCRKACLYSAGRGRFSNVQQARIKKTQLLFKDKQAFVAQLFAEFPHIIFYDYSKAPLSLRSNRPSNYYLTQSYSELFDLSNWLPQE